jgi:TrmH family RNA methyltransferase
VDWSQPAALIIGGEADGVSPELAAWASEVVAIPLAADVESLNAAVAGSILLFEAARQRRLQGS